MCWLCLRLLRRRRAAARCRALVLEVCRGTAARVGIADVLEWFKKQRCDPCRLQVHRACKRRGGPSLLAEAEAEALLVSLHR